MAAQQDKLHRWRFFRSGGFDQVRLDQGVDLVHLAQLDQKLWATLSCPTRGLEFDPRTLALLDRDDDGHIRVPEVISAVQWACRVLKRPDDLLRGAAALPLESINTDDPEGKKLYASAKQILRDLGKGDADVITTEDTADTTRIFEKTQFNGDGIVTTTATNDRGIQQVLEEIIQCIGAQIDRSGQPGVSQSAADAFFNELHLYSAWWKQAEDDAGRVLPLGERTLASAETWRAVRAKIDDYFMRCRLVAFDGRAVSSMNRNEKDYEVLAVQTLSAEGAELAAFPLARVEAPRARLLPGQWVLEDAVVFNADRSAGPRQAVLFPTELTPDRIENSFASPDTLSFWALPGFIEVLEAAGFSAVRHRLHFQSLLALPVLACAMALLSAGFSMRSSRRGGVARMLAAGVAGGPETGRAPRGAPPAPRRGIAR